MDINAITTHPSLGFGLATLAGMLIYAGYEDIKHRRTGLTEPRLTTYFRTLVLLWVTTAAVMQAWRGAGFEIAALGFEAPTGRGAWIGWGATALVTAYIGWSVVTAFRSGKTRASLRRQMEASEAMNLMRPETGPQQVVFQAVSVTAGFTEEIIFRGFLISVLALALPIWAAAVASIALFLLAHLYQGLSGMLRIMPITVILTALYIGSGSLWPVIIIHVVVDSAAGLMTIALDRHAAADAAAAEAAA